MTAFLRAGVLASFSLPALLAAADAVAEGPLRGNPVDALPRIQTPANTGAPQPQPTLQAPTPEQQAVQARLAQRIVPRNFDVAGVRALPFDEVAAYLTPLAGKETTVGALVTEVNKITELYRERGYPLSFALLQNQSFANGLVVVTVVEGYIGNVRIDGDIGNARDRLESLAAPLLEEKPLTQPTLERVLNLMRTVPGVQFQPSLDLPRRADGATELVLAATRRPVTANGGVADLGTGMQPLVNVAANSLTPMGEQVKLTSSIPLNTDDVRFVAAEIAVPLNADGLTLHVDAHHYRSHPQDDAVERLGFDRQVTNNRVAVGLSYPLLLNNRRSLTATADVYAVNAEDLYESRSNDYWLRQDVDVRAATAELRYRDVLPSRSTEIGLGVSQGFNAAGAGKKVDTNYGYTGVPDVALNFTRYNLDVRQTFSLPAQFGLVLSGAGQYTDDVLPSSEQVSYGSWRYAMGYPQGEKSGDKGVGLSAEINRRFGVGWKYLTNVQPYAMVDYARTWYNNRAIQNNNPGHLSSVGLGMRFTDDKYYLFDVNVAKPVGSRTLENGDRDLRFNANYSLFYDAF
ncbi:ShlB/FhaC/HecB family hemolysin secretion/activation protein [Bordetella petrii]|uniref:ShlB/FhaC/HecB family hemolysin secretion/activation protein n=1 Tax=Bordetella petrii TaxID=94624 RepID=UPI001E493D17|nr:POTRA domain-containing protein [Bordetella petrii]MCD0505530.1 ShlB/FhaC/HecB family hemolysin secretion/activation protein [Bordetella petrii]